MQPTPYILPKDKLYRILTGNHVPPIVDGATNTFWAFNAKEGGDQLLFLVFLQPLVGEAKEVLRLTNPGKDIGQGGLSVQGSELWASAFRSADDALSRPFVEKVPEYTPQPSDAAAILTEIIRRLSDPTSRVSLAVAAIADAAIDELKGALRGALGK